MAQDALGIPRGTIRATVLIETILAAFEMEEILYELRDHSAGLNAGRWDYIFSAIKKFHSHPDMVLPDRIQVTMTVPFMRAYTELLVKTCHSRKDQEVNEQAFAKVREDKARESGDGFDGTWVAHPDLVPIAQEAFDRVLGERPNQKDRMRQEVQVSAEQIATVGVPGGKITENGLRMNISVALQYLDSWLGGNGAAAIFNLMEDAATAEISRSQLWQWLHYSATLDDGREITRKLYFQIRDEELRKLGGADIRQYRAAVKILDELVLENQFRDFLTLSAYDYLD
jgi:malate synthase